MGLEGPAKTIRVEPLTVPAPAREAPATEPAPAAPVESPEHEPAGV